MGRCSGSSRRIVDFAGVSLGIGDELGNRLSRDRWIYRHDKWCAANASDWRDIADEIVVELVVECRIDRVETTDQEKRVAVCGRAHDDLGADIAAATRPNKELAAEPKTKSPTVGMSGGPSHRVAPVTANARNLPALTCSAVNDVVRTRLAPVRLANRSPQRLHRDTVRESIRPRPSS